MTFTDEELDRALSATPVVLRRTIPPTPGGHLVRLPVHNTVGSEQAYFHYVAWKLWIRGLTGQES